MHSIPLIPAIIITVFMLALAAALMGVNGVRLAVRNHEDKNTVTVLAAFTVASIIITVVTGVVIAVNWSYASVWMLTVAGSVILSAYYIINANRDARAAARTR